MDSSPPPHRRSRSLLSFDSNLYPPPSKSFFFRALLKFSPSRAFFPSPKKTLLNSRGESTTRPSSLLIGRPQKSPLILPSPIRAQHTNTLSGCLETKRAMILVQHLDTCPSHHLCSINLFSLHLPMRQCASCTGFAYCQWVQVLF
ncbi:hypothetical protein TNCV_1695381 [Trichonephila clavipes]|nr:hypothetical protein TNCV_1695381 [Trichonephila clavipes]